MERYGCWVSSGLDGTIRLWSAENLGTRLAIVHCKNPVQVLALDTDHGWVLAGVKNELHVFDPESLAHLKTHVGHEQLITGIAHVHHLYHDPVYVTSSFDQTIKIWRASNKAGHHHHHAHH